MNLVYYSLAANAGGACERQWVQSARSLRRHNRDVPVYLFVYNQPSDQTLCEADRLNVCIVEQADHRSCFDGMPPVAAAALSHYPTMHRFLSSLHRCPKEGVSQILFLDCDTFFFGDVQRLFERYCAVHFYARAEPNSRRSPDGYHPRYLDESLLSEIARAEGLEFIPPYNLGVCMFNHGVWHPIQELAGDFLGYAWRLLVGMRFRAPLNPNIDERLSWFVANNASEHERRSCLVYPSSNSWILDQIAFGLMLGRLPGLSHDVLSPTDVWQGGEYVRRSDRNALPLLAHYYSSGEDEFFADVGQS